MLEILFEMRLSEKICIWNIIFLSAKVRLNIEKLEAVDKLKKKTRLRKITYKSTTVGNSHN